MSRFVKPEQFREQYARALEGDAHWRSLEVKRAETFHWDPKAPTSASRPSSRKLASEPLR